jgi:ComF family protein
MIVASRFAAMSAVPRLARTVAGAGIDLLFPRRCGLCGAFGSFLCGACSAGLPPALAGPRCPSCALLSGSDSMDCRRCKSLPLSPLDGLIPVFQFQDRARRLVHRLKYEYLSALAEPMGRLMARHPDIQEMPIDLLVPVPLHPSRQRARGFNQSALLAREIGRHIGVPVEPRVLTRTRATAPQARTNTAGGRMANVDGAFACRKPMTGRHVLLVDDVATTGATLRACASPLRAAGAVSVHAIVFAHEE